MREAAPPRTSPRWRPCVRVRSSTMAEDSPCRRTPNTMPSSVHSMGEDYRIPIASCIVIPGRCEASNPESREELRVEPALRIAGEGVIKARRRQRAGDDLDDAVEL